MKIFRYLSLIFIMTVTFGLKSCTTTKESYLSKFDSFVENVKDNGQNYDEEDWRKAEQKFTKLSGAEYKKFESELTPQEKLKVVKLIGQYRGAQLKSGMKYLKENVEDAIKGTNEFIEEIKKELN